MVTKQAGFYGKPFWATRGVRQRNILSPMIFNIVVDAIIRFWRHENTNEDDSLKTQFNADDGTISDNCAKEVQQALDIFTDGFPRMGLKMNSKKMVAIVITGGKVVVNISDEVYARKQGNGGLTSKERRAQKVDCRVCEAKVSSAGLNQHQWSKKFIAAAKKTATKEKRATNRAVA